MDAKVGFSLESETYKLTIVGCEERFLGGFYGWHDV